MNGKAVLRVPLQTAPHLGQKYNSLENQQVIGNGLLLCTFANTGSMLLYQVSSWDERIVREIRLESSFNTTPQFVRAHYPHVVTFAEVNGTPVLVVYSIVEGADNAAYHMIHVPRDVGEVQGLMAEHSGVFLVTATHLVHFSDYVKGRGQLIVTAFTTPIEYKITQALIQDYYLLVAFGRRCALIDIASGATLRSHTCEMPITTLLYRNRWIAVISGDILHLVSTVGNVVHEVNQTPPPSCISFYNDKLLLMGDAGGTLSVWKIESGENICRLYTNPTSEVDPMSPNDLRSKAIFKIFVVAGYALTCKAHSVSLWSIEAPYDDVPLLIVDCSAPLAASNFHHDFNKTCFRVRNTTEEMEELWLWAPDLRHFRSPRVITCKPTPKHFEPEPDKKRLKLRERSRSNPVALEPHESDANSDGVMSKSMTAEDPTRKNGGDRTKKLFRSRSPRFEMGNVSPRENRRSIQIMKAGRSPRIAEPPFSRSHGGGDSSDYYSINYYRQAYENMKQACKKLQIQNEEQRATIEDLVNRITSFEKMIESQNHLITKLQSKGKSAREKRSKRSSHHSRRTLSHRSPPSMEFNLPQIETDEAEKSPPPSPRDSPKQREDEYSDSSDFH